MNGRVKDFHPVLQPKTAIIEPSTVLLNRESVLTAMCLWEIEEGNLPVRVINLNDHAVTVHKNTTFGVFEGVKEVAPVSGYEGYVVQGDSGRAYEVPKKPYGAV